MTLADVRSGLGGSLPVIAIGGETVVTHNAPTLATPPGACVARGGIRLVYVAAAAIALSLIACGGSEPSTDTPSEPSAPEPRPEPTPDPDRPEPMPEPSTSIVQRCVPGQIIGCRRSGTQTCLPDGSRYGECIEPEPAPSPEPLPEPEPEQDRPEPEPEPECACFAVTTYAVTCGPLTVRCDDTGARGEAPCGSLTEFEEQVYWDNQVRLVQASYTPATAAPFAAPVSSCIGSLVQAIAGDLYPIETVYGTPGCTCRVSPFAIQCSGTQTTELGCGGGL